MRRTNLDETGFESGKIYLLRVKGMPTIRNRLLLSTLITDADILELNLNKFDWYGKCLGLWFFDKMGVLLFNMITEGDGNPLSLEKVMFYLDNFSKNDDSLKITESYLLDKDEEIEKYNALQMLVRILT